MRQLSLIVLCAIPAALLLAPAVPTPGEAAPVPAMPVIEPKRHKSYTQKIPGSKVQFDMVAIPAGISLMGSPPNEKGRGDDEGPRHRVSVGAFWMGKMEVTWDEYNLFRAGGPASERDNEAARARDADAITRPSPSFGDEYRGFGNKGYPAVGISHHAAMEYCRWLSRRTGRAYRLPTEAEWEWACRAGTCAPYYFGTSPGSLDEYAWHEKNSQEQTHPVGKKKPNPWGLHDVYGNVAEWCLDHYQKDFYSTFRRDKPALSPVLRPTAKRYPHVVRGGSWADEAPACRSSARRASDKTWNKIDPNKPKSIWWLWDADFVGFRVVRAVVEDKKLIGIKSLITRKSE